MKNIIAFSLLAALLITLTWVFASEDIAEDLSAGIVRLHILANSDTAEDQQLKLTLRDRLLAEAGQNPELLNDEDILTLCRQTIAQNGYDYPVTVERGRFYFPRKSYDSLTLPAGEYNAVRIVIGTGGGQNWWCVMYPPLCFAAGSDGVLDSTAMSALRQSVSPESFAMICESDSIAIKPSFKLVELWQELKSQLTGS